MKKIASMTKIEDKDISDVRSLMDEVTHNMVQKYNEVLRLTIEQYLGRPFNIEIDNGRFRFVEILNTDVKQLFADDFLIGTLKTEFGLNGNDFAMNRISGAITFTPINNI